ncbi:MAG: DNA protecting protein DprA [Thermobacillus sp. ZCTH02-B1]|uniref:DNA-processing protein DprA n=1 Tax=Thermobacillus sp. ZCTH02-B1 TaxID=1858795 RepID=UPI000B581298|nr:DNA-processing protein DprA [Thermobacillus sp. ZCTH02-B1]OUM96992.1 MAG: DNA protecting protein DprA [Thermobacillus sp. ZCTH02-B1]
MGQALSRRDILLALVETEGVGAAKIRDLRRQGLLEACVHFSPEEWILKFGLTPRQADAVRRNLTPSFVEERKRLYARMGVEWLTLEDEDYPELLRQLKTPPGVLYVQGRRELLHHPAYAIVGTRLPTAYGRQTARMLAERLSDVGITIVSGLARGIDACAHEGALRGPGSTIAVLGTPIGVIYPPQNAALYHRIAEQGLLVSPFPHGTAGHPGLFPARNAVIAGLARGTIVVEAAERSGALITADMAMEFDRELYAVPGMIGSPKSIGTNRLIKEKKATILTGPEDVMADLWLSEAGAERRRRMAEAARRMAAELKDEEHLIVELLREGPKTADELAELTGIPFGHLHALLLNLTVKRAIEQHPGSLYSIR